MKQRILILSASAGTIVHALLGDRLPPLTLAPSAR